MSLTAYTRVKMFWGALSVESGYDTSNSKSMGADAVTAGGIGVRRAQLVFTRTPPVGFSEDVATMHFDFVNFTAGLPDDTWTTADFTTLETALTTWWTAVKPKVTDKCTFSQIRWYRIGPGVTPPNPAVRVTTVGVAATGSAGTLPPQLAISISNKTALRRRWGRTYVPMIDSGSYSFTDGRIATATCDAIANATGTLSTTAAAADFQYSVYSPTVGAAYGIEQITVDNIFDVIRSRRWDTTTYRKTVP